MLEFGATGLLVVAVLLALLIALLARYHEGLDRQLEAVLDEHDAVRVGALVRRGADVRLRGEESNTTVLLVAAGAGDIPLLRKALAGRVQVDARDGEGNEALMRAAGSGSAESVRLLLAAGANVSTRNGAGKTPLMAAAESGAPEVVQLLLEHGAEVAAKDRNGRSALDRASSSERAGASERSADTDYPAVIQLLRPR